MLEDSTLDVAERTELWILMGLPGEWLEMALSLRIRFEHEQLKVGLNHVLVVGLPSLVSHCVANPATSSYYISGFQRMALPCRSGVAGWSVAQDTPRCG